MNFKPRLDRKVVGTLVIAFLMFILMAIESPYRFSPNVDTIRLLYFPLLFLAVYGVLSWASAATSERQLRLNKMERLIGEMDQADLDVLHERLMHEPNLEGIDGEYESLETLLQEKQKHQMR